MIFSILCIKTVINIGQIIHYKNKTNKIQASVEAVDTNLIKDIETWRNLDSHVYLKRINFKTKFIEKMKGIDKKLQNVSVKIEQKAKQIIFNPVYEEK